MKMILEMIGMRLVSVGWNWDSLLQNLNVWTLEANFERQSVVVRFLGLVDVLEDVKYVNNM